MLVRAMLGDLGTQEREADYTEGERCTEAPKVGMSALPGRVGRPTRYDWESFPLQAVILNARKTGALSGLRLVREANPAIVSGANTHGGCDKSRDFRPKAGLIAASRVGEN